MPERGPVGMGIGGGSVRVGVRNRLGEAIGKPVANLHGRWTSAATVPREKGKKGTPVFSKSIRSLYSASDPILTIRKQEGIQGARGVEEERKIVIVIVRKDLPRILDRKNLILSSAYHFLFRD